MKKICLLGMMICFVMQSYAQYTIKATGIPLTDGTKMRLEIYGENTDSAIVRNGEFSLMGDKKVPISYVSLRSDDNQWGIMFWLGNDQVTINGTTGEIVGAKEEDAYQSYQKWMDPVWNEMKAVSTKRDEDFKKNGDTNWDYYTQLIEGPLKEKEDSVFLAFCDKYPNAHICLNHIYNCRVMDKYSFKRYSAMAAHLDTTNFAGRTWETFKRIYRLEKTLEPGNPFPVNIEGTDVYGDKWSLSDYRGKYTLMVISGATYDGYHAIFPELCSLYDRFHAKGYDEFDFLLTSDRKDILKHAAKSPARWNLISDYNEWRTPLLDKLEMDHINQFYFLSPDGTILSHTDKFAEVKEVIEKTMK